jgi:hypothetical protein
VSFGVHAADVDILIAFFDPPFLDKAGWDVAVCVELLPARIVEKESRVTRD